MPDISKSIRERLLSISDVTDLVGTRISADVLPQNVAMPAITYEIIDTVDNSTLNEIADVSQARIQIDCYANDRGTANNVSDKVRLALQSFRGVIGSQFVNSIQSATGEQHFVDEPEAGTDQRRYVTSRDFFVFYRTTTE